MTIPDPINVLHVRSCRGGGGGPEKTILFTARESPNTSLRTHIAYLRSRHDPEFDLDRRATDLGIPDFVTIEEDRKLDVRAMKRLLREIRERDIHVYHGHCYKSDLYGLILAKFHPMALVTTVHGPLASFRYFWASKNWKVRYLYDQIDLRLLRYFDHVTMVSNSMRKTVLRYGVKPHKLTWVKNAIDSERFHRDAMPPSDLRQQHGLPAEATVIGAVGRLNGEKDYPNFFQMAKLLLARRPDLYFTIAGKGELEEELRQQLREMGLENRVILLGYFHDVRPVYAMMDVYVLSSTREGLPNTVLEAMAMEVPIAATDVDGVREAAAPDEEALLVPARDPLQLAAVVDRLLSDPALARRLTSTARAKIENEFSFANRIRHEEAIYRHVLGDPRGRHRRRRRMTAVAAGQAS